MDTKERENLVMKTMESIFDGFSESVSRVAALFESPDEALDKFILPELQIALNHAIPFIKVVEGQQETVFVDKSDPVYYGEVRNLSYLLGKNRTLSFEETIKAVYENASANNAKRFYPGDYIEIPVNVPAVTVDGYDFDKINAGTVRLVVTAATSDAVMFNFEDVIFQAPINVKNTNKGGFAASTLAKYLNDLFLKAVFGGVASCLAPNKDGLKITLPTRTEIFGEHENYPDDFNWEYKERHQYFKKCTNRIKVNVEDFDGTNWWWNYTPTAASASSFCGVYNGGSAYYNISATNTSGGVAPAICVAKRHG